MRIKRLEVTYNTLILQPPQSRPQPRRKQFLIQGGPSRRTDNKTELLAEVVRPNANMQLPLRCIRRHPDEQCREEDPRRDTETEEVDAVPEFETVAPLDEDEKGAECLDKEGGQGHGLAAFCAILD